MKSNESINKKNSNIYIRNGNEIGWWNMISTVLIARTDLISCPQNSILQSIYWISYISERVRYRQEWKLTLNFSCLFACLLGFSTTQCLFCWFYHYKWVFLFASVPLEMNILQREYFNRWYSLLPSFLAIILIEIPIQVWDTTIYHFTVWSRITRVVPSNASYLFPWKLH